MLFKNSCTIKLASKERIKQWATIEIPKQPRSGTELTKEVNTSTYEHYTGTNLPTFIHGYTLQKRLNTSYTRSSVHDYVSKPTAIGSVYIKDSLNQSTKFYYRNRVIPPKCFLNKTKDSNTQLYPIKELYNHQLVVFPINDTINDVTIHPPFSIAPDGEYEFASKYYYTTYNTKATMHHHAPHSVSSVQDNTMSYNVMVMHKPSITLFKYKATVHGGMSHGGMSCNTFNTYKMSIPMCQYHCSGYAGITFVNSAYIQPHKYNLTSKTSYELSKDEHKHHEKCTSNSTVSPISSVPIRTCITPVYSSLKNYALPKTRQCVCLFTTGLSLSVGENYKYTIHGRVLCKNTKVLSNKLSTKFFYAERMYVDGQSMNTSCMASIYSPLWHPLRFRDCIYRFPLTQVSLQKNTLATHTQNTELQVQDIYRNEQKDAKAQNKNYIVVESKSLTHIVCSHISCNLCYTLSQNPMLPCIEQNCKCKHTKNVPMYHKSVLHVSSVNSFTGKMHKNVLLHKNYEGLYSKIIKPNEYCAPKFLKNLSYNRFWICLPIYTAHRKINTNKHTYIGIWKECMHSATHEFHPNASYANRSQKLHPYKSKNKIAIKPAANRDESVIDSRFNIKQQYIACKNVPRTINKCTPVSNFENQIQHDQTNISNPYTPYQCSTTGLGILSKYFVSYYSSCSTWYDPIYASVSPATGELMNKGINYWLPEPVSNFIKVSIPSQRRSSNFIKLSIHSVARDTSINVYVPRIQLTNKRIFTTFAYSTGVSGVCTQSVHCASATYASSATKNIMRNSVKILRVHTPFSYTISSFSNTSICTAFYGLQYLYFNTISLKKSICAHSYSCTHMHDINTKVITPSTLSNPFLNSISNSNTTLDTGKTNYEPAAYALQTSRILKHTSSTKRVLKYTEWVKPSADKDVLPISVKPSIGSALYDPFIGIIRNGLIHWNSICTLYNETQDIRINSRYQGLQTFFNKDIERNKCFYGNVKTPTNFNTLTLKTDKIVQRLPKVNWNKLHLFHSLYNGIIKNAVSYAEYRQSSTQPLNTRMTYRPLSLFIATKVQQPVHQMLYQYWYKYSYTSLANRLSIQYDKRHSNYFPASERRFSLSLSQNAHNAWVRPWMVLNNIVACYTCTSRKPFEGDTHTLLSNACHRTVQEGTLYYNKHYENRSDSEQLQSLAIGTNSCNYKKLFQYYQYTNWCVNQMVNVYVSRLLRVKCARSKPISKTQFTYNLMSELKELYPNKTFGEGNYYMLLAYEATSNAMHSTIGQSAEKPMIASTKFTYTTQSVLTKIGMWKSSATTHESILCDIPIYIRERKLPFVSATQNVESYPKNVSHYHASHYHASNSVNANHEPVNRLTQHSKGKDVTKNTKWKNSNYYGKFGEVSVADTLNYRTLKPVKNGLFCETLFGPIKDWQCQCGKLKFTRSPKTELWCPNCLVQITRSVVRRVRMGYIKLAAPVMHVWYKKQSNNPLVQVLSLNAKDITSILDAKMLCVASPKWINCCTPSVSIFHFEIWEHEIYPFIKGEQCTFDTVAPWNNFGSFYLSSMSTQPEYDIANSHVSVADQGVKPIESSKFSYLNDTSTFAFSQIFERLSYKQGLLYIRYKISLLDSLGYSHKSLLQKQIFSHVSAYASRRLYTALPSTNKKHYTLVYAAKDTWDGKAQYTQSVQEDSIYFKQSYVRHTSAHDDSHSNNVYSDASVTYTLPDNTPFAILQKKKALLDCFTLFKRTLSTVHSPYTNTVIKPDIFEYAKHTDTYYKPISYTGKNGYECATRQITPGTKLQSLFLSYVPVLPPDLRPIVQVQSGKFATSDVNDLYRFVIFRNNRLKRFLQENVPEAIFYQELRLVQHSVDALFDNSKLRQPISRSPMYEQFEPLKSLSDRLVGKRGRFRLNLLGKRVDYSGRSVIVVGPKLKLFQCALPIKMAFELFFPFLIQSVLKKGLAKTTKSAKVFLREYPKMVRSILGDIIHSHPVILNRAPTLHRMGVQSFFPVLVEGKAIQLHPLMCPSFNADFDGDQMAVHLPLRFESQVECRFLMLSPHNWISPADGESIINMSQDMVLGFYYLTFASNYSIASSNLQRGLRDTTHYAERGTSSYEQYGVPMQSIQIGKRTDGFYQSSLLSEYIDEYLTESVSEHTSIDTCYPSMYQYTHKRNLSKNVSNLLHTRTIPSESSYECTRFGMKLHDKFWMHFNDDLRRKINHPTFTITRSTNDDNMTSCIVSRTGWVYQIDATTIKFQDSFGKDRSLYVLTTIGRFIFNNYLFAKM